MLAHEMMKEIVVGKKKANSRITLRWIASRMSVSSGQLSEVLRGKRRLTDAFLQKFCAALKLSTDERNALRRALQDSSSDSRGSFGRVLTKEQVESLADWKPFALMSFFQTLIYDKLQKQFPNAEDQAEAIARTLNLSPSEVNRLLGVMTTANLIAWNSSGRWEPIFTEASTGIDIPSEALRKGYLGHLELAAEKINSVSVLERDFTSVTFTMDIEDIEKAKKMLRNFRRDFVRKMEKSPKKGVFQMNIQFFPLVISS